MKHKSLIFLFISFLILGIMLWFVGIGDILGALKIANLWFIALAVLIQVVTYYLYTLRWQIINKMDGIEISIKELFPIVMVGLAANNITPAGRGGGEPVRAYILSRDKGYPMEETFATVVADKALDTFPFVFLAILTIIGITFYFKLDLWILILMVVAVIAIVACLILLIYMSVNPKFERNQIIIDERRMIVPAFLINDQPLSHILLKTLPTVGI